MSTRRFLLALVVLLGTPACDRPTVSADTPPRAAAAPVAVRVIEVVSESVTEPIFGTGLVIADKTTDLGPTVDGTLEAVLVDVGDRVRRGQPLFRLRAVEYELRVDRERAAVALAEAELAKTALDLERTEELRREHVVSDDRLDAASTAERIARARLERAQAELAQAEQDLRDTTSRAPYDGVITRRFADEGAYVRAMPGAGGGVVEIQKVDVVIAVAHVPEVALPRLAAGTPAIVRIDGLDREVASSVAIINDRVEQSSHAVELRIPLPNPDLEIKPGLFVKIELAPPGRRVLVLDRRAVSLGGDSAWVWMLAGDGTAQRRAVTVRELDASRVEIRSGLAEGDRVLLPAGAGAIEEGVPVVPEVGDASR
jgi:RND family efflux transporter MFP subunit